MMNKWSKVLLGSTAVLLAAATLVGCSSNDKKKADSKDDVPTLLMYQIGDKPKNYDELMEIANKRIEEKTGARLNLQYIGWGDYGKKMSVIVSSGENYDIAKADNYLTNAQKGAYTDLTELMPKHAKEAYDMIDPAYIKGNSVDGKLFAFPVNANVFAEQMLTFNKELLDKYDISIDGVKSYQDLEPILEKIKEKDPTVTPLAVGQGFKVESNMDYVINNGMPFAIDLEGDKDKIINQFDNERHIKNIKTIHDYYNKGFIPKDAATSNTEYPFEGTTWLVRQETQGPYDYGDTILTRAAGKPLVSKSITSAVKTTANAQMASFVVSSNSKHKEKAVEVLGLLNSDPELVNGLIYGVEGESWEKVGDNRAKLLDGFKNDNHMSAWNTANNAVLYPEDTITDEQIAERDKKIAEAEESSLLGFSFKTDSVKTEITNLQNVMSQYLDGIYTGTLDPDKAIPEMKEKLDKAGYEKVLKEMQKQFDEFRKESK